MKLYDFGLAANAQRVRVFLAEKGIDVPTEEVNLREGGQFTERFAALNPFHCVPVLKLDDGTVISESITICRYFEELHPEPSLFGRTARERALVDMWLRRFELDGFMPMLHAVRNHVPTFAGRVVPGTRSELRQLPEMVERGKEMAAIFLDRLEPLMKDRDTVTLDRFTVADISGYFTLRMTGPLEIAIDRWPNVKRWFEIIGARPAFKL